MKTQPTFFDAEVDVSRVNPLCHFEQRPCPRRGVCVYGPPVQLSPGTVNRSLTCQTCGCRGDQASNA